MKITFTLEQVQRFYALSHDDQRKVLEVAYNLNNETDDNIEKSVIDTSSPLLAQELTENAIDRIQRRRQRKQAIEKKRKLAEQQQIIEKKSAKPSKRLKEIYIQSTMSPENARHLLWVKTNFDKFIKYILEGFSLLKTHAEGRRIFDEWNIMLSKLRDDLKDLWQTAPYMLHAPRNRPCNDSFSYSTIVA